MQRFYYGWVIVALTFTVQVVVTGARYSFGVFLEPISSQLGWSISLLSLIISGFLLCYGLAGPFVGNWADRFGARRILLGGIALMGAGLIAAGLSRSLWQFALAMVVIVGLGYSGLSPVVQSALISRWFTENKGRALGISSSGIAIGQMLLVPAAMYVALTYDWRAGFYALGLAILALLPMAAWGLRDDPAQLGLGAGQREAQRAATSSPQRTPVRYRVALHTAPFWLLSLSFFGCGFTMLMMATHLPNMLTQRGVPPAIGGLAIGIIGGASALGTVLLSSLSDRFGRRTLLAAAYLLRAVMLVLFIAIPSTTMVFVFAVLFGMTWIVTSPLTAGLSGDFYGSNSVGRIYGVAYLRHQIGAFTGTTAAGVLFDLTGGYTTALWLGVAVSTLSFLLAAALPQKARPILPAASGRAPLSPPPGAVTGPLSS
ncbi:MAG TPA: MFS transporter [Bacillota bacterium]